MPARVARSILTAVILLSAASCDRDFTTDWVNEGEVCVVRSTPDSARAQLAVSVTPDACPSCCYLRIETSCDVQTVGTEIIVNAQTSYTPITVKHNREECCEVCPDLTASCLLPDLVDGDYTVVVGDDSFALTLPLTDTTPSCLGTTR